MSKEETRTKRIQIRLTPAEDELLEVLALELHTTKHNVGSLALSLGLTAFRKAIDAGHASVVTLPVFKPDPDDFDEVMEYALASQPVGSRSDLDE